MVRYDFGMILDPSLGFAAGLAVALLLVLGLEVFNSRRLTRITAPVYEFALKRAEQDAGRILEEARAEARKIIAAAETAGAALSSEHTKEHKNAEQAYQTAFEAMLKTLEQSISENARTFESAQQQLIGTASTAVTEEMKSVESRMAESIASLEAAHKERLEGELKSLLEAARQEAQQYAQSRKQIVDQHIVTLIGETMRITLQRALPKEAHAELVQAALDDAKANGVF